MTHDTLRVPLPTAEVTVDAPAPAASLKLGHRGPLFLMAGPCVLEDTALTTEIATEAKAVCAKLGIPYIFKASYDKANRTSVSSYRGLGRNAGLELLQHIRETVGVPVVSDVHAVDEVAEAAQVLDVLQIPAFLCRQTDLLIACGETGKCVNLKKGQFVAPHDIRHGVEKIRSTGNARVLLTERGATFGYNNLVVDMRGLAVMQRECGVPVVFDAGHSVQSPGGQGASSGGDRGSIPVLARAAVAAGCDGIFLETHPDPDKARSDGPNSWPLGQLEPLLRQLKTLADAVRAF